MAPYSAVAALFGARLVTSTGNDFLLNVATTAVAVLVVLRQNLVVRERRELLERQRDGFSTRMPGGIGQALLRNAVDD